MPRVCVSTVEIESAYLTLLELLARRWQTFDLVISRRVYIYYFFRVRNSPTRTFDVHSVRQMCFRRFRIVRLHFFFYWERYVTVDGMRESLWRIVSKFSLWDPFTIRADFTVAFLTRTDFVISSFVDCASSYETSTRTVVGKLLISGRTPSVRSPFMNWSGELWMNRGLRKVALYRGSYHCAGTANIFDLNYCNIYVVKCGINGNFDRIDVTETSDVWQLNVKMSEALLSLRSFYWSWNCGDYSNFLNVYFGFYGASAKLYKFVLSISSFM